MSTNTLEQYLQEADAHFNAKEYDKAFETYKRIIEERADYMPVYLSLQRLIDDEKEYAVKVKPLFLKAANVRPNSFIHWFYLAYCCYKLKEYAETIEYYKKALSLKPDDSSATHNLGLAYAALQEYDKAFETYKKLIEQKPDYMQAYTSLQALVEKEKNFAGKAKPLFITGTAANPDTANLWFNLAYCCYELKEYELAIQHYEKALSLKPDHNNAANNLGLAYSALKEYDKAFEVYRKLIEQKADYPFVYDSLRSLVKDKKEYADKAKQLFLKGANANPNSADFWFYYANYYYDLEEYTEAITNYKKVLTIKPGYNDALIRLRFSYKRNGEAAAAIIYYKEYLKQTPHIDAYDQLLYFMYYEKQINDFVEFSKELGKKDIDFRETNYQNIIIYNDMIGKNGDSVLFFTQLIESKKTDDILYRFLGYAYSNDRSFSDAAEQHTKAVDLNPSSTNYYDLGNVFLDNLNYKEALRCYDEALSKDKTFIYAKHNKIYILEKQGEYNKAYREWQELAKEYEALLKSGQKDQFMNPVDGYYYLGNIYLHSVDIKNLEKAREAFEESIKLNKDYIAPYIGLIKYYAEKKLQITDQSKNSASATDELHSEYNKAHMSMNNYFFKGVQQLEDNLKRYEKNKLDLYNLGELYLLTEQYDKAKKNFEECVSRYPRYPHAYVGLGVANMRTKNYKEAIENFTTALQFDPDDFNVQSNLSEAHLKSGNLAEAEKGYKKILVFSPNYIDALMGLAEYYKIMGDKAMEEKNVSDAEEWYQQARSKYDRLVDLNNSKEATSRRLNRTDLNNIYYSRGYVKVKLFEIGSNILKRGISLKKNEKISVKIFSLQSPREDFKQILPGEDNYFKARNAIRKINNEIGITKNVTKKSAPLLIILAAFVILLFTQYAFFIGRQETKPGSYSLNLNELSKLLNNDTSILDIAPNVLGFAKSEFTSKSLAAKFLDSVSAHKIKNVEHFISVNEGRNERIRISETSYGLFTFSSLVFIIIGFFLAEITKLKVGSIELEKSVLDTASTSHSLNIK